jgi:hypothetical protein
MKSIKNKSDEICINSLAPRLEQATQPSSVAQGAYSTGLQLYSLAPYLGEAGGSGSGK